MKLGDVLARIRNEVAEDVYLTKEETEVLRNSDAYRLRSWPGLPDNKGYYAGHNVWLWEEPSSVR